MADADWPAADALMDDAPYVPAASQTETPELPPRDAIPHPRNAGDDLIAALIAEPTAHGFYRTMRDLEALHVDRPRFGRSVRPSQDALRLAQEPSAIFAPSLLAGFEPEQGGRPARLLVHFFGLFGPDGPLPLHLTDHARDRRRNARDPSFQRFADIFHHRALSLFYRAWADVRPTVSFDRPHSDRFGLYAGALIGLGMDALRDRDAMPDLTKLHFAGRLANQTRHAEGLAAILSAFFTMPVRIECFVGVWLALPQTDCSALGDARAATLGRNILLGARVWSRQQKFRVVFGPLDLDDYLRLLPGGLSFHRLIPLVRNYVGDTLLWDVNIVLKRAQVPPTVLGRQGRLGWTSWLLPRRKPTDAADLYLDASADSMAHRIDAETPISAKTPGSNPSAEAVT